MYMNEKYELSISTNILFGIVYYFSFVNVEILTMKMLVIDLNDFHSGQYQSIKNKINL